MKASDGTTSGRREKRGDQRVQHAGDAGEHHRAAERQCAAEVPEVALTDAARMLDEYPLHAIAPAREPRAAPIRS
jgi:hypothetical protein